jgi:hypothetical protein
MNLTNKIDNQIVYVLCPANYVTGGPDALHQMVFYLNKIGVNAQIVYIVDSDHVDISIPTPYNIYINSFLTEKDIVDLPENCIIFSEVHVHKIKKFKNAKPFLWWLSVDNGLRYSFRKKFFYFSTLPLRMVKNWWFYKDNALKAIKFMLNQKSYSFWRETPNITHLCASYYAYDYVSRRSHNRVVKCIEPISKLFLKTFYQEEKNISKQNRKNVILFNPVRDYNHILNEISSVAPELQFEPLQNLTQQQLIDKYKSSKLYIDFGAFPGAERIPKEAVLFGCAIITGKRGASGFHGDVPIPEEYKFGNPEKQIKEIVEKIRFVLNNYEQIYSDFDEYRNTVLNLEENFIKSLKEILLQ